MADAPCPRLGKLFGGCKFSPRYDTVSATKPDPNVVFWQAGREAPKPTPARSTYLGDVCTTCGRTLFRRKPTPKKPADYEAMFGAKAKP